MQRSFHPIASAAIPASASLKVNEWHLPGGNHIHSNERHGALAERQRCDTIVAQEPIWIGAMSPQGAFYKAIVADCGSAAKLEVAKHSRNAVALSDE